MVNPHLFDSGGGKRSMDDGNVDAGLFECGVRILQSCRVRYSKCAGDASTSLRPRPTIAFEFWSRGVELLETRHDFFLKIDEVFCDLITKSF